ncbi:myosin-7B-like [Boleophthalmus pectinirostris]|uniref:myosin-7B-like n=1 Tax=Boleophthalmus pectinirostris TaxID=150288 RepID=UPI002432867C|nr:myosin-7B-like [Boleophthalmus pectinirostris]
MYTPSLISQYLSPCINVFSLVNVYCLPVVLCVQEQQRAAVQLKQAEAELSRLRRSLEEREKAHTQCTAEGQLQASHWALELLTEVSQLQGLLQNNSSKTGFQHNPSPTVEEALSALRSVREQVQSFTQKIQEELLSLKSSTEKMHSEKERELSVQRQQLRRERDHALDALKERLIQEHIEELSSLQREGPSQEVLAYLRSQLRAKDSELKQVQRSMVQWKELTAHRMACKFEEELSTELERHVLKAPEQLKGPVTPKEEQSSEEKACPLSSVCSVLDCSSDTASLKLLLHLQTRVKQLRVDNQNYSATHGPRDHTAPLHCCTEEAPRDKHQCS